MSRAPFPLVSPETTPLLSPSSDETPVSTTRHPRNEAAEATPGKSSHILVLTLLLLYVIFLDLGYELIVPAQTRIFESIYCKEYYQKHDPSLIGSDGNDGVDEKWCKVSAVQGDVAMLKGWQLTFDCIGIPLRVAWWSAFHTVLGGGVTVATALIYTIVSDIVPEGSRVTFFLQIHAANITTQFLGSLAAAGLMTWNPWVPMVLGLIAEMIAIVLILFIPETLQKDKSPAPTSPDPAEPSGATWRTLLDRTRRSMHFLVADPRIILLLFTFVVHMLFLNRDVLLQYISTRYHVSLAQATVTISVRSGLVVLISVAGLPIVNNLLRSRIGSRRSDLYLSRASVAVLAFSFVFISLAPNYPVLVIAVIINALGWGLYSFLRSLLTSLVEEHHVARLNSFIGIFDTVGLMIGSPLLAILFKRGVELGGLWYGIPFLVCAGFLTIIGVILGVITVKDHEEDYTALRSHGSYGDDSQAELTIDH
ncbi:MFS general substrate transporter [Tothia fuscella]|uniref:MFS general substrate transporter n=1 Tax=Tothia fuscella TaxID=1048955 RepID=A0A9P4P0H2_9PEZI|nr:MFS general substrate transporter [Tothia fuscella]